jgi:hypothetical protein
MHEVEAIERELQAAVAARDLDTLERLLGPEFTLTTGRPGTEVRGRAEYLEITASRSLQLVTRHVSPLASSGSAWPARRAAPRAPR